MDTAKQHWEILRQVPEEMARKIREFMVIGDKGVGVIFATEDGDGYWLGEMKFDKESKQAIEPTRLNVPNLASMAQNFSHILLLNESGQIYAMGENNYGQLGLGTVDQETHFTPQLIPIPHKFISVRCAYGYSLALTDDGQVWAWGSNTFSQLGLHSSRSFPTPRQISELDPHRVVAVECGGYHSLALTDQGEVYGWGWNDKGQLGDRSKKIKYTPTQFPTTSPIQIIAAGRSHTMLLTQTGEVYACGENACGQLGVQNDTRFSPSMVKVVGLPPISQIASHLYAELSIAITTEKKCFAWGYLGYTLTLSNRLFFSTPFQLPPLYSTLDSVFSAHLSIRNTPCSIQIEGLQSLRRTNPAKQTVSLAGPIRLGARIARMFDNPDSNPDVKFKLGNEYILAHRSVLQISSVHFDWFFSEFTSPDDLNPPTPIPQSSFNLAQNTTNSRVTPISPPPKSPLTTIPIPDHSYPTFHAYLHFLYTGTLQVPTEHLADLFELAHSHLESDLSELCLVRMRSTLSTENCCLFYQLTERHSLPEFQQKLVQFISTRTSEIYSTAAYRAMDPALCKSLTIAITDIQSLNKAGQSSANCQLTIKSKNNKQKTKNKTKMP